MNQIIIRLIMARPRMLKWNRVMRFCSNCKILRTKSPYQLSLLIVGWSRILKCIFWYRIHSLCRSSNLVHRMRFFCVGIIWLVPTWPRCITASLVFMIWVDFGKRRSLIYDKSKRVVMTWSRKHISLSIMSNFPNCILFKKEIMKSNYLTYMRSIGSSN